MLAARQPKVTKVLKCDHDSESHPGLAGPCPQGSDPVGLAEGPGANAAGLGTSLSNHEEDGGQWQVRV